MKRVQELTAFAVVAFFNLSVALAQQDAPCMLGKEHINFNNGATTNGKSGLVICKRQDGTVVRKVTLKDGKPVGFQMSHYGEEREEWTQDENGRRQGAYKRFNGKGRLIDSQTLKDGDAVGLQETFYDDGKSKYVRWHEPGEGSAASNVEYNPDGSVATLKCSPARSYTKADKSLCGFSGAKTTTLMTGSGKKKSEVTYNKGSFEKKLIYGRTGSVVSESTFKNGDETEKTFFDDGKLKSETFVKGRNVEKETEYFMNGEKRRVATFTYDANGGRKHEIAYWDNGKVRSEGDFAQTRMRNWMPIEKHSAFTDKGIKTEEVTYSSNGVLDGEAKYYDDKGILREQSVYKNGSVTHQKLFTPDGKVESEKEFYADGSSKVIK
jgi:antitoxin component YwqK of YwqJK toxin-antitoxin module